MNYKKNKLTIKNHNYDNDVFQKLFEELEENLQYINEDNFYHPSCSDQNIIDKFEVNNSFINFYEFKIDSVTV